MHQASGYLLESDLFTADVILFQAVEPINMSSALHQPCLHEFQSFRKTIRVVCLSAIEVNVLSVYAYSLDLIWNNIWRSLYSHCLEVKELHDRATCSISNTKSASKPIKCKYPYSSEKGRHLRMKVSCWAIITAPSQFRGWLEAAAWCNTQSGATSPSRSAGTLSCFSFFEPPGRLVASYWESLAPINAYAFSNSFSDSKSNLFKLKQLMPNEFLI